MRKHSSAPYNPVVIVVIVIIIVIIVIIVVAIIVAFTTCIGIDLFMG